MTFVQGAPFVLLDSGSLSEVTRDKDPFLGTCEILLDLAKCHLCEITKPRHY